MKIFIDTEFIESGSGKPIHLLSLGAVADNGEAFYGEVLDAPVDLANDWVKENVLPHLGVFETTRMLNKHERISCSFTRQPLCIIASRFKEWVDEQTGGEKPEFWGYYADYDWVVLCQMFGAMLDLPEGWPMYCLDLKQWCHQLGDPKLPEQKSTEHNALMDAIWNREVWEFLDCVEQRQTELFAKFAVAADRVKQKPATRTVEAADG